MAWLRKAWAWLKDHLWLVGVVGFGGLVLVWRSLRGQVRQAQQERDVAKVDAAKDVVASLEEQRRVVLARARDAADARARVAGQDADVAAAIRAEEARVEGMSAEDVAAEFRRLRGDEPTKRFGQ